MLATYVSALTFLGGPAWAYTSGLSALAIHLNYPIVIVIVTCFFLPFFYNSGCASIYEYQEKRFGPTARSVTAILFLILQTLTSAAVLYTTALVLKFITGVEIEYSIIIITVIALIYTIMGGITAVIWTDVLQAGILLVGAAIIFYALTTQLSLPLIDTLSELKAQGKTNALNFSFDYTEKYTVWTGLIAMVLFHTTVYGANQMMVQRTLAARNIGDAKKAYMLMGFGAFFIYFMFFLLGILFYAYYGGREFEDGNLIILQFVADYGMPGLMGLIAAAVLAASMSSLDSAFNSMATVSTIDFYQKYYKTGESSAHYLKVSRVFTLFWGLAIIVPAFMYTQSEGSILETLTKVGGYFIGSQLSMYALGFFSKQTTEKGLLVGIAVSFLVVWWVAIYTDLAWPWFCVLGAGVSVVVSITVSLALNGPQTTYSTYTIRGQQDRFRDEGLDEKDGNWYVMPGKVDNIAYVLLGFFVCTVIFLYLFNLLIP